MLQSCVVTNLLAVSGLEDPTPQEPPEGLKRRWPKNMPGIFGTWNGMVSVMMDIDVLKRKFALELARNGQRPEMVSRALLLEPVWADWVAANWPSDPEVVAYLDEVGLCDKGLPTEVSFAHYVWSCAQNATDDRVRFRYLKLYGEIKGLLKRPAPPALFSIQQHTSVMVVTHIGDSKRERSCIAEADIYQ